MKQNQTFFMGYIQVQDHFSSVSRYSNISMAFIIEIFQFSCKSQRKQVRRNKIKGDMCKSDGIFPYLQSSALFK